MDSSDDESEDFIVIGIPLKLSTGNEVVRKPIAVQDQTVVDEKGRPLRFHGAFTGGFSAGYFNSVGSKEGWTPSSFVSSRTQRADKKLFQPEHFMDDEDFGEHGIAERRIVATNEFHEERVMELDPMANLLRPARSSIGTKLLRKLGWKEGQGVGPRLSRRRKVARENQRGEEINCCEMSAPGNSSDSDVETMPKVTFAPQDINPIDFKSKTNQHGLGYSGMSRLQPAAHSAFGTKQFLQRKTIRGQAFGLGDEEDEDDKDVYGEVDNIGYDYELGGPDVDDNNGWTAPGRTLKKVQNKELTKSLFVTMEKVLQGFACAQVNPNLSRKIFLAPELPKNFKPFHVFEDKDGTSKDSKKPVKNAVDRAAAYSEQPDFKTVFDLLGERDREKLEFIKSSNASDNVERLGSPGGVSAKIPSKAGLLPKTAPFKEFNLNTINTPVQSFADKQEIESLPNTCLNLHQASLNNISKQVSLSSSPKIEVDINDDKKCSLGNKVFEPFARDPLKQARYQLYLQLTRSGKKDAYEELDTHELTEWEKSHEREEFQRASILYRPLTGLMASRFTTASSDYNTNLVDVKAESMIDTSDQAKAAQMKMYGQLTRNTLEWHPDNILCKRFNVPNPFPESNIIGVPTVKRDKYSIFNFLTFPLQTAESVSAVKNSLENVSDKSEHVKSSSSTVIKPLSILGTEFLLPISKDTSIKPLSILGAEPLPTVSENTSTTVSVGEQSKVGQSNKIPEMVEGIAERPSMDLFKAIFADDESAEESFSEDDAVEGTASVEIVIYKDDSLLQSKEQINVPREDLCNDIENESIKEALVSSSDLPCDNEAEQFGPALPPSFPNDDIKYVPTAVNSIKLHKKARKEKKKKSKNKSQKKHRKHRKRRNEENKKTEIVILSDSSSSSAEELIQKSPIHRLARPTAADFL